MVLKLWTWEIVSAHSEKLSSEVFVESGNTVLDFLTYGMPGSKPRQYKDGEISATHTASENNCDSLSVNLVTTSLQISVF